MDLKQIKADFDNGVIISRATWSKVLAAALANNPVGFRLMNAAAAVISAWGSSPCKDDWLRDQIADLNLAHKEALSGSVALSRNAVEAAELQTLLMNEFECYRPKPAAGIMAWARNALFHNSPHRAGRLDPAFRINLERSRDKYPNNASMLDGLCGELHELKRAYRGDGDVRAEALDVAVCAYRLAVEGDSGGNKKLDLIPDELAWGAKPKEWADYERIADLPAVHEAFFNFGQDQTADNATCIVRAILEGVAK